MFDDERNEEELAVKSRKGNFSFWLLNLGMGPPLGATRLAEQMGGKTILGLDSRLRGNDGGEILNPQHARGRQVQDDEGKVGTTE